MLKYLLQRMTDSLECSRESAKLFETEEVFFIHVRAETIELLLGIVNLLSEHAISFRVHSVYEIAKDQTEKLFYFEIRLFKKECLKLEQRIPRDSLG